MRRAWGRIIADHRIGRLSDYISHIIDNYHDGWVFRGQKNFSWDLVPSIDRDECNLGGTAKRDMVEQSILSDFKKRARPYHDAKQTDDWEWLAIAQHHGLPTRLLDWTSNALVALYFAVEDLSHSADSAVWCLDSFSLGSEIPPNPFEIKKIQIFYPPHINKRIIAQSGYFTVHPSLYYDPDLHRDIRLIRIKIPQKMRQTIREHLGALGFHRAALFPDMDGLAAKIRQDMAERAVRQEIFPSKGIKLEEGGNIVVNHLELSSKQVPLELKRFRAALDLARHSVRLDRNKNVRVIGRKSHEISDSHRKILRHSLFTKEVRNRIREERVNAEFALSEVLEERFRSYESGDDEMVKLERATLLDVGKLVLACISKIKR